MVAFLFGWCADNTDVERVVTATARGMAPWNAVTDTAASAATINCVNL